MRKTLGNKDLVNLRTKTCPSVDITAENNYVMCRASQYGHLKVIKYLISLRTSLYPDGVDITADDNYAIRYARENGYSKVVKYLEDKLKLKH